MGSRAKSSGNLLQYGLVWSAILHSVEQQSLQVPSRGRGSQGSQGDHRAHTAAPLTVYCEHHTPARLCLSTSFFSLLLSWLSLPVKRRFQYGWNESSKKGIVSNISINLKKRDQPGRLLLLLHFAGSKVPLGDLHPGKMWLCSLCVRCCSNEGVPLFDIWW